MNVSAQGQKKSNNFKILKNIGSGGWPCVQVLIECQSERVFGWSVWH